MTATAAGAVPAARREMFVVLAVLGAAAAVLLLSSGRTWVRTAADPALLEAARSQTGSALAPGLPALGLVGLAGVVAVLATRGRLRQAVGAVVALDGLAALGLAVTAAPSGAVVSGWRSVAVVASVAVALAGVAVAGRGRRWPTMGGRYDAPAAGSAGPAGDADALATGSGSGGGPSGTGDDARPTAPDRALWDAIERGDDPTA